MDPRYPIGKYAPPQEATPALRQQAISAIAEAPAKFRAAVKGLNEEQLNTPYREGGWTVRQVAHHVPDGAGADHQAVRRGALGGVGGCQVGPGGCFAGAAGFVARPLGAVAPFAEGGRFRAHLSASGSRSAHVGLAAVSVRVARSASHRARHRITQTKRLVIPRLFASLSFAKVIPSRPIFPRKLAKPAAARVRWNLEENS
jgi:hypothetical protein